MVYGPSLFMHWVKGELMETGGMGQQEFVVWEKERREKQRESVKETERKRTKEEDRGKESERKGESNRV